MNPTHPARPEFLPDPALSRAEMETLQREIGEAATFADDFPFDPGAVCVNEAVQTTLDAHQEGSPPLARNDRDDDPPLVAGIDQAFLDDRAIGAVVVLQGGEVVARAHAVTDLEIPYIPGLLAFREGEPILAALAELSTAPDLLVLDGSGRIHFRQAGIATHVGVLLDRPAIGVAKSLLCGEPDGTVEGLSEGTRVPIHADGRVEASEGTLLGYAYQSRQFDSPNRSINPLYVSPGHRVSAETAVDLVAGCCAGYKLPEPTRLADAYADEVKAEYRSE